MRERLDRAMPKAALIVAMLALIVAAGSGAYAAVKLKKNAVKTKNIKNKAVTTPKLADKAVTTAQLADKAVTAANLADGAVGDANLAPCKTGFTDVNGVCIENNLRPADSYFDAVQDCKAVGARLPSPQELLQARTSGVALASPPLGEKTSDLSNEGGAGDIGLIAIGVTSDGTLVRNQFASTTIAFRCAYDR